MRGLMLRLLLAASLIAAPLLATAQVTSGISSSAGCTVGTSSAPCLAANAAHIFVQIQNTTSGTTNAIACNWGGAAVLNDRSSFMLWPGQSASWGRNLALPTTALNCIATSASGQLYVEYR